MKIFQEKLLSLDYKFLFSPASRSYSYSGQYCIQPKFIRDTISTTADIPGYWGPLWAG